MILGIAKRLEESQRDRRNNEVIGEIMKRSEKLFTFEPRRRAGVTEDVFRCLRCEA